MREDHEEIVLRNPALGARAFWHLARSFADRAEGRAPELPYFALAAGMLFHRSTVDKIKSMQFESGILKAVADRPDIVAGLQTRIECSINDTLLALQVGTSSGILLREGGVGLPSFRAAGIYLPKEVREAQGHVNAIFAAAKRLGAWFTADSLSTLQSRLGVRF